MQASLVHSSLPAMRGPPCTCRQALRHSPSALASGTRSITQRSPAAAGSLLSSRHCISPAAPLGLPSLGSVGSMRQRGSMAVRAESVEFKDRAVAALPYLVPLFDGLRYGKFALAQNPIILNLLAPLDPLLRLYTSVPFASLIVFFAIYGGIINKRDYWSRYVRFNAMQAILLDIILILPGVLENVIKPPVGNSLGLTLYINAYNTIFFFVLACWLYGSGACLLGRTPRLPLVADAADQQVPY